MYSTVKNMQKKKTLLCEHTILNQQMDSYYYFLDIIYYNLCKLVKHISIPSWDHHQGLLWEYELHKQN
jgi:hypothetical protein